MNFDDTPQEAAFRAEARQWIGANAPKEFEAELSKSSLGRIRLHKAEIVDVGKAWQKKKAEAGWACLHWPKEYGGRGATPIERVIWQQEEGVYGKLTQPFQIGEGMCGPTVMAYGNEEHKRHYLPKLASGEQIWCQLFSEPAGGSDVAGLRTRAEHQVRSRLERAHERRDRFGRMLAVGVERHDAGVLAQHQPRPRHRDGAADARRRS
jgi:alkylation response protein AidB-like acyl-CoA dehydrogenase